MSDFECPCCEEESEVEMEDLPDRACDDMEYECPHCGSQMIIGWRAEIEVRMVASDNSDTAA